MYFLFNCPSNTQSVDKYSNFASIFLLISAISFVTSTCNSSAILLSVSHKSTLACAAVCIIASGLILLIRSIIASRFFNK